jgi:hypothetical protein
MEYANILHAGFCAFEFLEWEVDQVFGVGPFTSAELRADR